jgi:hypothetical protein
MVLIDANKTVKEKIEILEEIELNVSLLCSILSIILILSVTKL